MESNRRLLLIINPISGTHGKAEIDKLAIARLSEAGFDIDTHWTTGPGNASDMARQAAENNYYGVIVAGGDGTVNEVAQGLIGSTTAMGILPCGSGNGLARHIGVGASIDAALNVIAADTVADVDVGSVNDRPFLCTCGVGFDARVSERFARERRRGRITYIKSTLQEFVRYQSEEYSIALSDGTVITDRAFLVAVCNASQYGNNAYIAPHASIRDGLLDVTIIHSGSPLTTALVGVDLLTGFIDHNMLIDTFRTNSLTIDRTKPGPLHADGEPIEASARLILKCHPGVLKLFAPQREKEFKPIITPMQSFFSDIRCDLKTMLKGI